MSEQYIYYPKGEAQELYESIEKYYPEFYRDDSEEFGLFRRRSANSENQFWSQLAIDANRFVSESFDYSSSTVYKIFKANDTGKFERRFKVEQIECLMELPVIYKNCYYNPETQSAVRRDWNANSEDLDTIDQTTSISDSGKEVTKQGVYNHKGFSINNPEWILLISLVCLLLPVIGVLILLISFYRVNVHLKESKNKIFKNIILSISLIINVGVSYIANNHFKVFYTENQINQLVNDTVSTTKKSIRSAQFHKDPNGKGKGFFSFGRRDYPSDEHKVSFLKPDDSKEIVVNCRLVNYGSFPIYNLSAKLEYDKMGNSESTRLLCVLESDNTFIATDSAYLTNLPSSWSIYSIFAEVENNQDTECGFCLGYDHYSKASPEQIDQKGIPLGDLDAVKGNSDGKKCPCDIIDISFHLLVTNTSANVNRN